MTEIRIVATTHLPADRVLLGARDFGARRPHVFPAVREEHFVLHSLGENTADVTEGTPAGVGINWERCRYEWSEPGYVLATVVDSNVYGPGSAWRITAASVEAGVTRVEMIWTRNFLHNARGRLFGTAFRVIGRPMFRGYARKVIRNLESLEHAPA